MKHIVIYTNATWEEEKALKIDGETEIKGDEYHEHISAYIDGFLAAFEHMSIAFSLEYEEIGPSNPMFEILGFYDNGESNIDDEINEEEKNTDLDTPNEEENDIADICDDDPDYDLSTEEINFVNALSSSPFCHCPEGCFEFCEDHPKILNCRRSIKEWIRSNRGSK